MSNKKIFERLNSKTDKNFRITKIRVDVLDCLDDGYHGHTIKDIIDHLNRKGKKVNVSSIYNTINFLIDEGIVEIGTNSGTKNQSFELINKEKLHIHLYDLEKDQLLKIDLPTVIEKAITTFLKSKGYQYENIQLDISVVKIKRVVKKP